MKKLLFMLCLILVGTSTFASNISKEVDKKDELNCEAEISIGYDLTFVKMKVSGTCAEVEAYIKQKIQGGWRLFKKAVPPPLVKLEDLPIPEELPFLEDDSERIIIR